MSYIRTPEHRALRAELIRRWKPWEKSTGPKTAEGKARSAMRGYKGGQREMLRELRRLMEELVRCTDEALSTGSREVHGEYLVNVRDGL